MPSPWIPPSEPLEPPELAPLTPAEPAPRRPAYRAAGLPLMWLIHLASVAALVAWVLIAHHPSRAAAVRAARLEITSRLEAGERVLRQAPVAQRHWWDLFRPTYGLLAATNRRLLFAGVAPPPLGSRSEGVPQGLILSLPYDTAFTVRRGRIFLGLAGGVVVSGRGARQEFFSRADRAAAADVVQLAQRRIAAHQEYQRREQRWRDSILALPPEVETYRVRRGDALLSIARRFNLTPEQLREMNALADDRVRVGQTLVVKVTPRQPGACPYEVCGAVLDRP
jgi:hypothetical protein